MTDSSAALDTGTRFASVHVIGARVVGKPQRYGLVVTGRVRDTIL